MKPTNTKIDCCPSSLLGEFVKIVISSHAKQIRFERTECEQQASEVLDDFGCRL
jgi:hypothetical protein